MTIEEEREGVRGEGVFCFTLAGQITTERGGRLKS
jgi:hypothetical protein